MKEPVAFEDAVDLLDADHKTVKKLFIEHAGLCESGASSAVKQAIAQRICMELTVHAQLEEDIFYPQVRESLEDDALLDEALHEHTEAKEAISRIEAMKATDPGLDAAVKELGALIDLHVLVEREQIFLRARQSALDLRGMALPLAKRQLQLKKSAIVRLAKETA